MNQVITQQAMTRLQNTLVLLQKKLSESGKEKASAAGDGLSDWHDNFAFDEASKQYQMIAQRIAELQQLIREARLSVPKEQNACVALGTSVDYHLNGEPQPTLTIGGVGDDVPSVGLVTYMAPLSRLLIGLRVGQRKTGRIGDTPAEVLVQKIFPPSYLYYQIQTQLQETNDQNKEVSL